MRLLRFDDGSVISCAISPSRVRAVRPTKGLPTTEIEFDSGAVCVVCESFDEVCLYIERAFAEEFAGPSLGAPKWEFCRLTLHSDKIKGKRSK